KIIRLHSFFYGEPDFKTPPATYLPFLSTFSLTGETENGFSEIEGGGWIWSDDIAPIEHHAPNMAATAQIFLNLPYLWGGKTSRGVDCSGLVQLALHHAGYACPRDSSDQEKAIKGENIDFVDAYAPQNLQKNDIVFLKGHVGIMLDETRFINATSRSMSVSIEDIKEITAHYEGGIRKVVRL
ncbi:MAG: C40 family peptidase, partial [Alphaproteobacteria bacterium]